MKARWTKAELALLREHWTSFNGAKRLKELLPHRSEQSLRIQAIRQGMCFKLGFRTKHTVDEMRSYTVIDSYTGCWNWNSGKNEHGYGYIWHDGAKWLAPRLMFALSNPEQDISRLFVLHRCDNPPCINPDHLYLGTKKQNSEDMVRRGRQNHDGYRGSKSPFAKLSEPDIPVIRQRVSNGEPIERLRKEYGVVWKVIKRIACREKWKHVP